MYKTRKRAPKVALSHLDESDLSDESVSYLSLSSPCFILFLQWECPPCVKNKEDDLEPPQQTVERCSFFVVENIPLRSNFLFTPQNSQEEDIQAFPAPARDPSF